MKFILLSRLLLKANWPELLPHSIRTKCSFFTWYRKNFRRI